MKAKVPAGCCPDCWSQYALHRPGCGHRFCPGCWQSCPQCGGVRSLAALERAQRRAAESAADLRAFYAGRMASIT
jgi:hypothetical protein